MGHCHLWLINSDSNILLLYPIIERHVIYKSSNQKIWPGIRYNSLDAMWNERVSLQDFVDFSYTVRIFS